MISVCWKPWAKRDTPLFLMQRIRCNNRVGRGPHRAGSANLHPFWRARPVRLGGAGKGWGAEEGERMARDVSFRYPVEMGTDGSCVCRVGMMGPKGMVDAHLAR